MRKSIVSVLSATTLAFLSSIPLAVSEPVQAQVSGSRCPTNFLPNTTGSTVSFTNGRAVLTLVRKSRVQGSPAFDVFLNNRTFLGTVVTPATIIRGQLAIVFRLRTNPFTGRVEQAAAATSCPPWRRI